MGIKFKWVLFDLEEESQQNSKLQNKTKTKKQKQKQKKKKNEKRKSLYCPISGSCAFQNNYNNDIEHCYSKIEKDSRCVLKI